EERLAAARLLPGPRDREHLVLAQERALASSRRARERAVAADVATQRRQRNEHLRRGRDEPSGPQSARLREPLLERRGAEVSGDAHDPLEHTSMVSLRIRLTENDRGGLDAIPVPDPR